MPRSSTLTGPVSAGEDYRRRAVSVDVSGPDRARYAWPSVPPLPVPPTSPTARPSGRAGTARRALTGAGLTLAVALGVVFAPAAAGARPAQDSVETTVPGTDTTDLGVTDTTASTTTEVSETTVAGESAPTVQVDPGGPGSDEVAAENRRIWAVVAALVAVALALTLLTVRYWRHTKPGPRAQSAAGDQPDLTSDGAVVAAGAAAAPAGAATAGTSADVESPAAVDVEEMSFAPPTLEVPVVVGAAAAGADAEQAAAAAKADHDPDEAWQPRATGEQERLVLADYEHHVRPTADQRRAAFASSRQG